MSFKPVDSKVDLAQMEDQTTQFWKENKIFQKSIEQRSEDNAYTFVDGPPFVSGLPHYGHLLTSIAKDVVPRYQTMIGKRVRRVWGWDCHGLPIEEKVNKLFGIRSSAELEAKLGVEKYVQECRKFVQTTINEWGWYVDKIGRWVDMENAYYTMNVDFMESVIWAFKQIHDKGLIYKGKRVSLFSTDTSTPVSNFEVAMDADNYRETEDLSVFVKFELKNTPDFLQNEYTTGKKISLIAWTTTPWSIPANFAIALNPNFEYSLVSYENELFIVAKERIEYTFTSMDQVKEINTFPGTQAEGVEYLPPFDYFYDGKKENDFKVYLSDDVTLDEGTGVLHIAPAFGEVDFDLGQKYGLSNNTDLDQEGKMTVGPWTGVYLRDANPLITEELQKQSKLLRSMVYVHRLPYYRGANPLIYVAQEAYFIDIQKIKARMLELNQDINWIPKHLKLGRFAQTVQESPDWCISRNRYWGTIMPIWKSEDGEELVIGSIEEMMQYTEQITKSQGYLFEGQPMDLHRDVCDKIILTKDGKKFHRIPQVLDVWMDSGSVPFAEYHYPFENNQTFEKSRPADFIIEYIPQVRAWFTVLMRISTIVFDDISFKSAIGHGTIAGTDGRKMSKSYGNYPDPKMLLEKYGADALRLYLMGSPVMRGEDMNFSEEFVSENYRFLLVFWNSYKYFIDYASIFNWSCEVPGGNGDQENLNILDKWILARLTELVLDLRKAYDKYDVNAVVKLSKEFIVNDFSTWYIRRSRDRISSNDNIEDRNGALSVMYGVLVGLTKLLAPLTPFITEEMYKNLTEDLSVHLTDFPEGDKNLLNAELVADMKLVREVVELGHAKRKETNIKLRQPLPGVIYHAPKQLSHELEQIILEELNVKSIGYKKSDAITAEMNTKITPELKAEGEARDIIRQIQQMRKDEGLTLNDHIKVYLPAWPSQFEELIKQSTAAETISLDPDSRIEKI